MDRIDPGPFAAIAGTALALLSRIRAAGVRIQLGAHVRVFGDEVVRHHQALSADRARADHRAGLPRTTPRPRAPDNRRGAPLGARDRNVLGPAWPHLLYGDPPLHL